MDKNSTNVLDTFLKSNSKLSEEEKISNAMELIFEIALATGRSHMESIGMLECVKFELQDSFEKSSDASSKPPFFHN